MEGKSTWGDDWNWESVGRVRKPSVVYRQLFMCQDMSSDEVCLHSLPEPAS